MKKTAIIIGAGPAGLTAAYELLTKTDIVPIVIEQDKQVGGLSKTIDYKGNKIDIGGHRFFSKSERVINWWLQFLPLQANAAASIDIRYHNREAAFEISEAQKGHGDAVMLLRPRKSRIYYQRKFFDYPLQLNANTIRLLGWRKIFRIGFSYLRAKAFPATPETNLAQFFTNRFGKELYETFFKDYTEKVWGVPCEQIPSSWGQQRVKDLNVTRLLRHAMASIFAADKTLQQKGTSTSLIEQFLYPTYGPGQLWEQVAAAIERLGGSILLNTSTTAIQCNDDGLVKSLHTRDVITGEAKEWQGDYFFSSMPVKELFEQLKGMAVPPDLLQIATALPYRDFLIVGILVDKLAVQDKEDAGLIKDNWIYVQDKNVKAGRLQVFNNWSPFMVKDPATVWLGVEYFCHETDAFWQQDDARIASLAIKEMEQIGILSSASVKDAMVARVKKAYPSYYGSYNQFARVQAFTDKIPNLFLVGRNGMHRYNNSDHSMLTAMTAVENIIQHRADKQNIWNINTEEDYHEEKTSA